MGLIALGRRVALALVLSATALRAQSTYPVSPGDRIRVRRFTEPPWRDGDFVRLTRDTLQLLTCEQCVALAVPRQDIAAVEIRVGTTPHVSTILAAIGVGTVLGAYIGLTKARQETRDCHDGPCGVSYVLVPLGGIVGFILGGVTGASIRYDVWRPAQVD